MTTYDRYVIRGSVAEIQSAAKRLPESPLTKHILSECARLEFIAAEPVR